MSFVKDDHSYTRGVGAVAAMDAASPGRRLAAARAARQLARRDALMAASALGRVSAGTRTSKGTSGGTSGTSSSCAPGDQTSEFGCITKKIEVGTSSVNSYWTCPPNTTPYSDMWCLRSGPAPVKRHVGRGRLRPSAFGPRGPMVKSPGSVIDTGQKEPAKEPPVGVETKGGAKEPTRGGTGSGGGSSGGSSGGATSANVGPLEPLPEEPSLPEEPAPAPAPPKPKTSGNLLLYAALGVGAYWLLTRK